MAESVMAVLEKVRSTPPLDDNYIQRFSEAASVDEGIPQGDVYFWKLPDDYQFGEQIPTTAQVVEGTTKGSRHILDKPENVEMFKGYEDAIHGPKMRVKAETTVTHPEHKWVVLTPGNYEVTYQRKFAEELKRQQD